jgi:hypothetical protein
MPAYLLAQDNSLGDDPSIPGACRFATAVVARLDMAGRLGPQTATAAQCRWKSGGSISSTPTAVPPALLPVATGAAPAGAAADAAGATGPELAVVRPAAGCPLSEASDTNLSYV